jgi:hypothetical protein
MQNKRLTFIKIKDSKKYCIVKFKKGCVFLEDYNFFGSLKNSKLKIILSKLEKLFLLKSFYRFIFEIVVIFHLGKLKRLGQQFLF